MKAFRIHYDKRKHHCVIGHETEDLAVKFFNEEVHVSTVNVIDEVEEIPESEWDEKTIEFHEDNDIEQPAFYLSIREVMEKEPMVICSNDHDFF